eukprot:1373539-Amorphochlora_amoeboformis.AAC.1
MLFFSGGRVSCQIEERHQEAKPGLICLESQQKQTPALYSTPLNTLTFRVEASKHSRQGVIARDERLLHRSPSDFPPLPRSQVAIQRSKETFCAPGSR